MSALYIYLDQFYRDPYGIEEYKINFLKNHYYPIINKFLNCEFNDFKIGVTKNKSIIWFINKKYPNYEIIYNFTSKKYYKDINKKRKLEQINIQDYEFNNSLNNSTNTRTRNSTNTRSSRNTRHSRNISNTRNSSNICMFFQNNKINNIIYPIKTFISKIIFSNSNKIEPI